MRSSLDLEVFFNFSPTSNHLYPLQVENCDSNSRHVVDEDDNGSIHVECDIHSLLKLKARQNRWSEFFEIV